jgi:hypothetical protein
MGAGTYTGIEAVSNGMPILREPRVETAKKTMRYMAMSLAFMAAGLMIGYLLYRVNHIPGKTLNAVLVESVVCGWNSNIGRGFILVTLISEALLLFAAAQTGFLDAPRVLANMAKDRWFPFQFALLSERFVTENGILLMGGAAFILIAVSRGSVRFLVVLYSINVFITFFLSQLGMVRHWWKDRGVAKGWLRKLIINGTGLTLTSFILVSVVAIKFNEGGWITIFITGSLAAVAIVVKRFYYNTRKLLVHLDELVNATEISQARPAAVIPEYDASARTAVILVNGFNGVGLHTLFNVMRLFGKNFRNFFFIQAGIVDAESFKGEHEIARLNEHVQKSLDRYVPGVLQRAPNPTAIPLDVLDRVHSLLGQDDVAFRRVLENGGGSTDSLIDGAHVMGSVAGRSWQASFKAW